MYFYTHTYVNILEYGHDTNFLPPQLIKTTNIRNGASKLRIAKLDL